MDKLDRQLLDELKRVNANVIKKMREEACTQVAYRGWEPEHCKYREQVSLGENKELQYAGWFVSTYSGEKLSVEDIEMGPEKYKEKFDESVTRH